MTTTKATQELSYYKKNRERIKQRNKSKRETWSIQEREEFRRKSRLYYKENKDKVRASFDKWLKKNPDKAKAYNNKWVQSEACKQMYREYRSKPETKAYMKEYRRKNADRITTRSKEYVKNRKDINKARHHERYNNDAQYKLGFNLRASIRRALKNASVKRRERAEELLGCTIEELKSHIERLWLDGMDWSNHTKNGWHIDHIRPCASFDLTDLSQQKECFHYTNLQPLWASENESKGSLFEGKRHRYPKLEKATYNYHSKVSSILQPLRASLQHSY